MEQTLIPLVLGRSIAIERLLSIAILHRSCGTRRRPSENASKVTYRVQFLGEIMECFNRAKTLCQGNTNCFSSTSIILNEKVNGFFLRDNYCNSDVFSNYEQEMEKSGVR